MSKNLLEEIEDILEDVYKEELMIAGNQSENPKLIEHIEGEWRAHLNRLYSLCQKHYIDYRIYYEPLKEEERYIINVERDTTYDMKRIVEHYVINYNVFNNTIKNLKNDDSKEYKFKYKMLKKEKEKALDKLIICCNMEKLDFKEFITE